MVSCNYSRCILYKVLVKRVAMSKWKVFFKVHKVNVCQLLHSTQTKEDGVVKSSRFNSRLLFASIKRLAAKSEVLLHMSAKWGHIFSVFIIIIFMKYRFYLRDPATNSESMNTDSLQFFSQKLLFVLISLVFGLKPLQPTRDTISKQVMILIYTFGIGCLDPKGKKKSK